MDSHRVRPLCLGGLYGNAPQLLHLSNSHIDVIRSYAISFLYSLIKTNMQRMALNVTIALSKLCQESYAVRSQVSGWLPGSMLCRVSRLLREPHV